MENNLYKVTYKNGTVREFKALSMVLKNGKVYQCCKHHPFENGIPSVFDGSNIASIECIEKNNDFDDLCVKVWEQDLYVYINEHDITEYKTDDLYYEQAYQLDDGRWIAYDEAVNAWVMLG